MYKGNSKVGWNREKIIILPELMIEKDHKTNDIYAEWSFEIIKSESYTECECAGCWVEPIKQKEKHVKIGRKGAGKRKRVVEAEWERQAGTRCAGKYRSLLEAGPKAKGSYYLFNINGFYTFFFFFF